MPKSTAPLELDVDLQGGVVPISKAASSLAALLKRSRAQQQPIVVTQKGYPAGVILDVELYTRLRTLAARPGAFSENSPVEDREGTPPQVDAQLSLEDSERPVKTVTASAPPSSETAGAETAPVRRAQGGRRNKTQAGQS